MNDDDSDNVVLLVPRPPAERRVCPRCGRFIVPGESYREVRVPSGLVPVHDACMGTR